MSLCGVLICSMSIGLCKIAALGVDPFQSLMSGLDQLFDIPFGTLYVIANLLLLSFGLIADRSKIGLGTFLNLFLLGYVTDFSYALLRTVIIAPSLPVRVVCMAVGIVVLCFSASLYMTANLGVSPYDAIALVMAEKWHVAPFRFCRIATDLVCVLLGAGLFLLGGGQLREIPSIIGVGTLITAFCMGPLVEVFNEKVSRPMLKEQ